MFYSFFEKWGKEIGWINFLTVLKLNQAYFMKISKLVVK